MNKLMEETNMKTIIIGIIALFFISNISNAQDSLYMYKAGAVISKIAIPNVDSIIFHRVNPLVTDIDGNEYDLVVIGSQTWFRQNLKTSRLNDGTAIPLVTDATAWSTLATAARCYYDNDSVAYKATYGALYNWYTVNTQKLCPTGFHVPSDAELTTLMDYLGGLSVAGGKLKEAGLNHWDTPNAGATNLSGFTAVSIGGRNSFGVFWLKGQVTNFWSSTEMDNLTAWTRNLHYNSTLIDRMYTYKVGAISVRCMKD